MASEAQRRAVAKYDECNTKKYGLKFNIKTDADIISRLDAATHEEGGKQGYIKRLIREDLARNS